MNIFDYLGLCPDHRKEKKVTQFVKHYDEVVEKHKGKEFVGQVKKDGVCSLTVILNGHVTIYSRTGKLFTNTQELSLQIAELELPDGVYMGELCCRLVRLEVLSGVVNPNRVNYLKDDVEHIPDNLEMYWFDLIGIQEFKYGKSFLTFKERYDCLVSRTKDINIHSAPRDSYNVYVLDLIELPVEDSIDRALKVYVSNGEEGIVIRDPEANWEAGHKGWRVMKKVRGIDYDLLCVDYEEGAGKYKGKIANLIFRWKGGKTIKAMLGKGWTHDMAAEMFISVGSGNVITGAWSNTGDMNPVGKIFQVYALEESSKGKLRLPKVGEHRHDKSEADI